MEAKIGSFNIEYSVRVSDDATRPRIDHKLGNFTVVIPSGIDQDPLNLLKEKESWVVKKQKEFLRFKRKIPERDLEPSETINILGEERKIVVEKSRSNAVEGEIILAEHLVERTGFKDQLEKTLRQKARETIEEKLEKYRDEISESYNKVFIRDQETRWGSCSSKSNLNFNWRLIMAPEKVLEYVVVHELVHLEEKSHNEEFWSRVREIMPDYKEANRWLAENSSKLVFDPEKLLEK